MVVNGNGTTEHGTLALSESQVTQLQNQIGFMQERIAELEFKEEDAGWSRLDGDSEVEFSKDYLMKVVSRSRLFFLHNPLIRRAVSLQADYVFAQGLDIQAVDPDVNVIVQDFADDILNVNEIMGHQARLMKEQTLMLDGNVFLILFTDSMDGTVSVRSILVDEVAQIICNPDDANEIWYYKRTWQSRQLDGTNIQKIAYYPDVNYTPPIRGRTTSFKDGSIEWNSPIYHIKVGSLAKSRFGIPEVYPALDWAQAFRKFLENWATIVSSHARFAWNLLVPGGKNSIVAAKSKLGTTIGTTNARENNPSPIVGSIFTANTDGAKLDPIRTSGATTSAKDGRELRMMVAAALGIPDTFFGDVDVGNLATARTLDRPTELKFRSRQQLWIAAYKAILQYKIRAEILAPNGRLHGKVKFTIDKNGALAFDAKNSINTTVQVVFPPILEHSITDRINAVANAVTLNGKTFAIDSPELAMLTIRLMLQALGISDVDEESKKIFDDIKKGAKLNGPGQPTPTDATGNPRPGEPSDASPNAPGTDGTNGADRAANGS